MVSLARVKITWSGFIGSPGYTNLYFRNSSPGTMSQAVVNNAVSKTDTFLVAVRSVIPVGVTLTVDPAVEEIEDTTGALVSFWAATPAAASVGTASGAYAAAAGMCVAWGTNAVRNNRRIRGRTFIVPVGGVSLATDGTIDATELSIMRAAATALIDPVGDARLVIWARPIPAQVGPPAVPAVDGASAEVVSSNIQDKTAVLTSRRD